MTPLMYATKDNRTAIMDRMIELGADVGARNNVSILGFSSCYRTIGLIECLKQACPRLKLLQVAEKEEYKARERGRE